MYPRSLLVAAALLLLPCVGHAVQLPTPLAESAKAIMAAAPEDDAPKKLLGLAASLEGKHYPVGNEWHLDQYHEKIKDLGGVYMGVGSDQSYLLIGMIHPEAAFLTDYDDVVVGLHRAYFVFFAEAENSKQFMKLWRDKEAAVPLLQAKIPAGEVRDFVLKVYGRYHNQVVYRLDKVARNFKEAKVPCFLTDADTYTWVRTFVTAGRVRAMRANLLADKGIVGVGDAVRKMGLTVRAIYTSNADTYWQYPEQFKKNISSLPFDDKSWYIRTIAMWNWTRDYIYTLQPAQNLVQWLQKPWVKNYRDFISWTHPQPGEYPFRITAPDPQKAEERRAKGKKGKG